MKNLINKIMKNIHILPTDKPSRLHKYIFEGFALSKESLNWKEAKHIYITSDEEIKEGDYCIDGDDIYGPFEEGDIATVKFIKITLTTDEQLIDDGVQAIDDEFLEWFVKNPSCEEVEVEELCGGCGSNDGDCWRSKECNKGYFKDEYKIIIPKEETKQETLEEAALIYSSKPRHFGTRMTFIDGAKWQEQQTIEEVFEWLTTNNYLTDLKETLIENFKNNKI